MGQGLAVPVALTLLWRVELDRSGLGGNPKVALLVSGNAGRQAVKNDLDEGEGWDTLEDGGLVNDWGRIPDKDAHLLQINAAQHCVIGTNSRASLVAAPIEGIADIDKRIGAWAAQCARPIKD